MDRSAGNGAVIAAKSSLDPLSAEEIRSAVRVVREQGALGLEARFVSVNLVEPDRAKRRQDDARLTANRLALVVLLDLPVRRVIGATVNLREGSLSSFI